MFHFTDHLGFFLLFNNTFKNLVNNNEELYNIVTHFYAIHKLKDYPELIFKALNKGDSLKYTFRFGGPLYERFLMEYSMEEARELFRLWYFEYQIGVSEERDDGFIYKDLRVVPSLLIDLSKYSDIYSEPWEGCQNKFIVNFVPKPAPPSITVSWP